KTDWMHLVDELGLTRSPNYLHHKGKPLLALWGIGFKDRPGTPARWAEILRWFASEAPPQYQATIMGGVPGWWRTSTEEPQPLGDWLNVFKMLPILTPWSVGGYKTDDDV